MALFVDLMIAVVVTLVAGGISILIEDRLARPSAIMPMILISILAGIAVLARRHRERIIPIAAIYGVLMFGVLVWLSFIVAWYQGRVEL